MLVIGDDGHLPFDDQVHGLSRISFPDSDLSGWQIDFLGHRGNGGQLANRQTFMDIRSATTTVNRLGRWIDFENDYKTMDVEFMESVWWVFKQLWNKDRVYLDFKVLPYSFGATTPLSNFEVNQGYADTQDPSITVRFRLPDEESTSLLAWTTTPWTLPANLAIAQDLQGDRQSAAHSLQAAIRFNPHNVRAISYLARMEGRFSTP